MSIEISGEHPIEKAWNLYHKTDEFTTLKNLASLSPEDLHGSLYAIFGIGFTAASNRAVELIRGQT